jgi:hypothetical protein
VLDPAVATKERVENSATSPIATRAGRLEPLVHHNATPHLETGRCAIRRSAERRRRRRRVGAGRDVGGVEPQVDAVLTVRLVQASRAAGLQGQKTSGSRTTCVTWRPSCVSDAVTSSPMNPPPITTAVLAPRTAAQIEESSRRA